MCVVSEGGEDTVWVSGGRRTLGLEVGKGKKGLPKRVALTSARCRRQDVKARVVPAGHLEEREAATVETPDKRDELGVGPTRKLELTKHSRAGDSIEGVGHVHLKHSPVGMEVKGRPKRMNHCLGTDGGGDAELVGDKMVVEGRTQLDAHSTTDKAVQDFADGDRPNTASRLSEGEQARRAEKMANRGGDVACRDVLGQLKIKP